MEQAEYTLGEGKEKFIRITGIPLIHAIVSINAIVMVKAAQSELINEQS